MPSEIAVPFHVGPDGRVATVSDSDAQVRQHVLALVNTNPSERVMVPGYGIPLEGLLFEGVVDVETSALQAETLISESMRIWEPGVALTSVTPGPAANDDNTMAVDVIYTRKDAADSGTAANVNVAVIGVTGTVREMVRG